MAAPATVPSRTRPLESSRSWPLADRLGLAACWAAGLMLCLLTALLVGYMLIKGLGQLDLKLLTTHPTADPDQSKAGGFLDPILGTFVLTAIGIAIAAPLGVAIAVWLTEYGRPAPLARAVESGIEVIAGTPSVVLAVFGLALFSNNIFAFLSQKPAGAETAFGRSFFVAGLMMSLIALPMVVAATREALLAVPNHVREASFALGKTRAATIRRVLLPTIRPGIATGSALGVGRIVGDTAIVIVLLGGTLQFVGAGGLPGFSTLRGTGSTLTQYVYSNSPAGEGNAPQKAYAAAFVLLLIVLLINYAVDRLTRGGHEATSWNR